MILYTALRCTIVYPGGCSAKNSSSDGNQIPTIYEVINLFAVFKIVKVCNQILDSLGCKKLE